MVLQRGAVQIKRISTFKNHRRVVDELAQRLQIQTSDDWYRVSADVLKPKEKSIVRKHHSSLIRTLRFVYPEFTFHPWLFQKCFKTFWSNTSNQRKYLDWLSDKLHISTTEEFYQLQKETVICNNGGGLLSYAGSLLKALQSAYPEYVWLPWKFEHPKGLWYRLQNQRRFMDWVAEELQITSNEGFYGVSDSTFDTLGGKTLQSYYGCAWYQILESVYPEYDWMPWMMAECPKSFWTNISNQRKYLEWLSEVLNFSNPAQFLSVSLDTFNAHHGSDILRYYKNSVLNMLRSVYPHLDLFPGSPLHGTDLQNTKNQRQFMDLVADNLGIEQFDSWLKVEDTTFKTTGGEQILAMYNNRLPDVLEAVYPEVVWTPKVQRHNMDRLAEKHGVCTSEDWYSITCKQALAGANSVLSFYGNSLYSTLVAIYPEYEWLPWKFHSAPRNFWKQQENQRKYLNWLAEELNIEHYEQWFDVTYKDILKFSGRGLLERNEESPLNALQSAYPEFSWTPLMTLSNQQRTLWNILQSNPTFGEIKLNYRHPELIHSHTGKPLELDFFIPSLDLALEYQGWQHYNKYWKGSLEEQRSRDDEKREACKRHGITLIEIPYWIDLDSASFESILPLIKKERPDIESLIPQ